MTDMYTKLQTTSCKGIFIRATERNSERNLETIYLCLHLFFLHFAVRQGFNHFFVCTDVKERYRRPGYALVNVAERRLFD